MNPKLVLLHGFTGSSENWQPHREFFSAYFDVLVPDLPGHGSNPAIQFSMADTAKELIEFIQHHTPEKVHLLGYSMGGRLALYLAIFYPEMFHSLILESASPGLASESERTARIASDEQLAQKLMQEGIEKFVDYWENIPLFATQKNLPEDVRVKLRSQRLKNNPLGLANSLRGMGTGVQPSLWDQLPELKLPVLILAGEQDTKFTQIGQQMHALIPDAQLKIIPNAGHTIHLEQPGLFHAIVLEFLSA